MDPTRVYAVCMCAAFVALLLPRALAASGVLTIVARKLLLDRFLVKRHRLIGPCTVRSALAHAVYAGCNAVSLWAGAASTAQIATRAAHLALFNAAPLFLSGHISVLADFFDIRLSSYQRLHRACGLMATAHLLLHGILVTMENASSGKSMVPGLYESLGAGLSSLLLILSLPFLRRYSYEIFLRLHQVLAVGIASCTIAHLWFIRWSSWPFVYGFGAIACAVGLLQIGVIIYRNKQAGLPFPRISITDNHGIISATLHGSRPLCVDAGQYINIWVPAVSLFSSHPFTVTSWSPTSERAFELFIQKRDGFTRQLHGRTKVGTSPPLAMRAFFSGPHGLSVPVWDFDQVLLFASDFGITAVLPYLRKILHGRSEQKSKIRRAHLVWDVDDIDLRRAVAPAVDTMFDGDRLNGGYILYVSVYNGISMETEVSKHGRYSIHPGAPDVDEIMRYEALGECLQRPKYTTPGKLAIIEEDPAEAVSPTGAPPKPVRSQTGQLGSEHKKIAVLVSAKGIMRDQVRRTNRRYLSHGFELTVLDYQPE